MTAPTHGIGHRWLLRLGFVMLLPALGHGACAQLVPGAQPPALQAPLPAPTPAPDASQPQDQNAMGAPQVAVAQGWGLCQCIADTQKLDFICPGSPQACQSACGAQFSFKPDALCRRGTQ